MGRPITPFISQDSTPERPRLPKSEDHTADLYDENIEPNLPKDDGLDDATWLSQNSVTNNDVIQDELTDDSRGIKRSNPDIGVFSNPMSDMMSEGIFAEVESTPFHELSQFSGTDSLWRRDTLQSRASLYTRDSILSQELSKQVDWKARNSMRNSMYETVDNQSTKSRYALFKGVRKVLTKCGRNTSKILNEEQMEWAEKTIGLDCRPGEVNNYLSPNEWLYDDMTVEVTVKQDIPYAKSLLHTVLESSRLEKHYETQESLNNDDPNAPHFPIKKDGLYTVFHNDIRKATNTLMAGVRCKFDFSGYRSILNHYRYIEDVPPIDPIKPSHYDSIGVVGALNDSINGICSLNLRVIDPNFFETGLRYAALSSTGKEMAKVLMNASKERLTKIMKIAQEEVCGMLSDSMSTRSTQSSNRRSCGPYKSVLQLMDRQSATESAGIHRPTNTQSKMTTGSSRASIHQRSRRGSIVKSTDDEKRAFMQNLTNSERDFYESYYRQLLPSESLTSYSLFDTTIMHLATVNSVSPATILSLDAKVFERGEAIQTSDDVETT